MQMLISMLNELDPHCHTVASGHAYSTVNEYALEAAAKGLKLIAITDHAVEMRGAAPDLYFMGINVIPDKIAGVEIYKGIELNIMDRSGRVDFRRSLLRNLDICIASLHPPCFPPSTLQNNTAAVINAMENPYIDIIGHLGDPRYPIDVDTVVRKAKETGTMIEINNASLKPSGFRAGSRENIKKIALLCKELGVTVIMGSDAHFHSYIGCLDESKALLEEIKMPCSLIANTVVLFKKSLKIRKG